MDATIEAELKRITAESGIDQQTLAQEYATLSAETGNPMGALAALKSRYKNMLGGISGTFTARVVGKGKTRPTDDAPTGIGYLSVWVSPSKGKYEGGPRILWDRDERAYSSGILVNQVIKYEGKLMGNGTTTIVLKGAVNPVDEPFPTVKELVGKVGTISLNDLSQFIGQSKFVKGVVGRTFETPVGGGCEITDVGAGVITVFANEPVTVTVGQELIVYGYISQRVSGDVVINARGLF